MTQQNAPNAQEEARPNFRTPPDDDFPTGPAVGEAVPDFSLPDQHGTMVNFAETRGDDRALVMFNRSARW